MNGRVAELVDAQDLKSCIFNKVYGFDSLLGYKIRNKMTIEEKKEIVAKAKTKSDETQQLWNEAHKDDPKGYIEFDDCKEGYTYKIKARNFHTAIFYKGVFYGIRHKFRYIFIDNEIHWDKDDHFGTVKPLQEIEKTPNDIFIRLMKYTDRNITHKYANTLRIDIQRYLDDEHKNTKID